MGLTTAAVLSLSYMKRKIIIALRELQCSRGRQRRRFRSLLLKSLQNFLNDAAAKKHARKRGGDVEFVSWDDWMAEAPSQLTVPARALESWPAERLFDLRWAATVVEHAVRRLREECESQGRPRAFETAYPCLG